MSYSPDKEISDSFEQSFDRCYFLSDKSGYYFKDLESERTLNNFEIASGANGVSNKDREYWLNIPKEELDYPWHSESIQQNTDGFSVLAKWSTRDTEEESDKIEDMIRENKKEIKEVSDLNYR